MPRSCRKKSTMRTLIDSVCVPSRRLTCQSSWHPIQDHTVYAMTPRHSRSYRGRQLTCQLSDRLCTCVYAWCIDLQRWGDHGDCDGCPETDCARRHPSVSRMPTIAPDPQCAQLIAHKSIIGQFKKKEMKSRVQYSLWGPRRIFPELEHTPRNRELQIWRV
jgi:hypothetical protein